MGPTYVTSSPGPREDHYHMIVHSVTNISKVLVDILCMFDCTREGALLSAKYAIECVRQKSD